MLKSDSKNLSPYSSKDKRAELSLLSAIRRLDSLQSVVDCFESKSESVVFHPSPNAAEDSSTMLHALIKSLSRKVSDESGSRASQEGSDSNDAIADDKEPLAIEIAGYLIRQGGDQNLCDNEFKEPITRALEYNFYELAKYLLSKKMLFSKEVFDNYLDLSCRIFEGNPQKYTDFIQKLALIASRMLSTDISNVYRNEAQKLKNTDVDDVYIVHLCEYRQLEKVDNLEGWQAEYFLPMRFLSFMEVYVKLRAKHLSCGSDDNYARKLKDILYDISITHNINQMFLNIIKEVSCPDDKDTLLRSLAERIIFFSKRCAVTLAAGYKGHTFYVKVKSSGDACQVDIYNAGQGVEHHIAIRGEDNLGPIRAAFSNQDEKSQKLLNDYIYQLLKVKEDSALKPKMALDKIYCFPGVKDRFQAINGEEYKVQQAGTCVATNHTLTLFTNSQQHAASRWLLNMEKSQVFQHDRSISIKITSSELIDFCEGYVIELRFHILKHMNDYASLCSAFLRHKSDISGGVNDFSFHELRLSLAEARLESRHVLSYIDKLNCITNTDASRDSACVFYSGVLYAIIGIQEKNCSYLSKAARALENFIENPSSRDSDVEYCLSLLLLFRLYHVLNRNDAQLADAHKKMENYFPALRTRACDYSRNDVNTVVRSILFIFAEGCLCLENNGDVKFALDFFQKSMCETLRSHGYDNYHLQERRISSCIKEAEIYNLIDRLGTTPEGLTFYRNQKRVYQNLLFANMQFYFLTKERKYMNQVFAMCQLLWTHEPADEFVRHISETFKEEEKGAVEVNSSTSLSLPSSQSKRSRHS